MENFISKDKDYFQWISDLALRFRQSQIKAALKVNEEMLRFYWSIGEDIEKRKFENRYGSRFYEMLSNDLKRELGLKRGLSPSTLKYARNFYLLYYQPLENRQQVVDDFGIIFKIPWSHHVCIIDKVKITEFDFPDLGQLAGYVAMVDDRLNTDGDKPAIGLLICKEKNTVLARYALSSVNRPLGISEYDLRNALPSTEEIEKGLMGKQ